MRVCTSAQTSCFFSNPYKTTASEKIRLIATTKEENGQDTRGESLEVAHGREASGRNRGTPSRPHSATH